MLIVGNSKLVDCITVDKIYNISSFREGFNNLNLIPPRMYYSEEKTFDIAYASYIMDNDSVFYDFMRIIFNLYMGKSVYLMVSESEFSYIVTESLCKFIQQRYGYNNNRVSEIDDLNYLQDSEFSFNGVFNLDQDKEKFSYMLTNKIIPLVNQKVSQLQSNGGSIDYDTMFERIYQEYIDKYI